MRIDKATRDAIAAAVERGIRQKMELYDERWLTASQLSERLPIFTPSWMAHNGHKLPRERMETIDGEGNLHPGRVYMYPLHKIQRMVADGWHKRLRDAEPPDEPS